MSKPPAFQMYPRDWLSDASVRLMGPAAKGLYIDLLCHQWLEGSIPSEPDDIALLVGYPVADLWPLVRPRFRGTNGDRLFNRRMAENRASYEKRRKNASKAGKISARKRAELRHDPTGVGFPLQPEPNPAVAVASAVKDVTTLRAAPAVDNLYERLGPHVRKLHPERDQQNRWIAWAKFQLKTTDLDTVESWIGGLHILRDRSALEWIAKSEAVTCKVFERFPQIRAQCETAWARYGPGSTERGRRTAGGLSRASVQ